MKKPKRKKITIAQYDKKMGEIIRKYPTVHEALIEMIEFTGGVEVVVKREKAKK